MRQIKATAPTHQLQAFLAELRVSRRHGRVCPEEQGRNLGRSVTAIYRLCSLVGRSYFRLQNFLGPMSLARWVIVSEPGLEKLERKVWHITVQTEHHPIAPSPATRPPPFPVLLSYWTPLQDFIFQILPTSDPKICIVVL